MNRNNVILLDGESLTLDNVEQIALNNAAVGISPKAINKIKASRQFIEEIIKTGEIVYGVNTGFGALSSVNIPENQIEELQLNLIRSHACGIGDFFSTKTTRAIMVLRANTLTKGYSGVRLELIEKLLELLNKGVHPLIPSKGSVGASGDLAPLAHLSLVLIGEGKAEYQGKTYSGNEALKKAGIEPISLKAKEGLSLINGTQVMTAMGVMYLKKAQRLGKVADIAGAMTLDAIKGTPKACYPQIHALRPHTGQIKSANNIIKLTNDSQIIASHVTCPKVQDPYSIRCIPQVHGASKDTFDYVEKILGIEINAGTDNPLVFAETKEVLSGGNFHGQPIALAMDFLGIALAELANISERRTDKALAPMFSGLPIFLTESTGLNSGLMITQYTAAALVSENKMYATPNSIDSIPTSCDKEDHVSMGTNAARKVMHILKNTSYVISIELLCGCQALDYCLPTLPGKGIQKAYNTIRHKVPKVVDDRVFHYDIEEIYKLIDSDFILKEVESVIGELE
ncbi:MAG: histidine ammonia-lyase [Cyanobacteriota bacterium]